MNTEAVKNWMRRNFEEFIDPTCGVPRLTLLAEEAAISFGDLRGLEEDIPEEYYEAALDVSDEYMTNR